MKTLFNGLWLVLLITLLFLGGYNHIESKSKLEKDNLALDVLPGDKEQEEPAEPTEILQIEVGADWYDRTTVFTIDFEKGMTWEEWIYSKYNTHGCYPNPDENSPHYGYPMYGDKLIICSDHGTAPDDLILYGRSYMLMTIDQQ